MTYTVTTEKVENRPGTWNSLLVTVLQDGNRIGSYLRPYPQLFHTFCPFNLNGQDYALFSSHYTKSSVMRLPSCEVIADEEYEYYMQDYKNNPKGDAVPITKSEYERLVAEDDANGIEYKWRRGHHYEGFCPVDFFVPCYIDWEYTDLEDKVNRFRIDNPTQEDLEAERKNYYYPLDPETGERNKVHKPSGPVGDITYHPFAFVSGCIWGDDTSYKIEMLDLSRIEEGILTRSAPFGYVALPACVDRLSDAIIVDSDPEERGGGFLFYVAVTNCYMMNKDHKVTWRSTYRDKECCKENK